MERGGAEGYAHTIARAAIARGWEVVVGSPAAEATAELTREFERAGATWQAVNIGRAATVFGRRPKPLVPWLEFLHAFSLFVHVRPDVSLIVLPGVASSFGVQMAAAVLGFPAASCFQLTPREMWKPGAIRARLLHWARTRSQAWISVSEHNASFVADAFGVPRDRLHVIYNGAPLQPEAVDRNAARHSLLNELQLPPDSSIILTVARLGIQKAHAVLLESIPHLLRHHANTHFVWIGEGEQRSALEARIEELGVGAHVHLLGFRHDVPRWLAASDLFAFPTHYEGLPFSLVEALAVGVPVLASAVSSIPEVLDGGAAGVLVTPNEPAAWSAAIGDLLDDPRRARSYAENGRVRAQRYSESRMTGDTLALLESLASGKSPVS